MAKLRRASTAAILNKLASIDAFKAYSALPTWGLRSFRGQLQVRRALLLQRR
jgi:hypothetical protein